MLGVGRLLEPVMPGWASAIVQGGSFLVVGLFAALYAFQEKILYVPVIPGVPNEYTEVPSDYGLQYNNEYLTAEDGVRLQCWFIAAQNPRSAKPPVMLFLQENAGNMSHRTPLFAALSARLRCAIFVLGYRGYGQSEGSPSQAGLELDSAAALSHLLQRTDIDTSRIVVFGRSLGGAVAIHLAAKAQASLRAVMVENTFTSVEDMAPKMLPVLKPFIGSRKPLNFLVRNKWRSADAIQLITKIPMLMFASARVRPSARWFCEARIQARIASAWLWLVWQLLLACSRRG